MIIKKQMFIISILILFSIITGCKNTGAVNNEAQPSSKGNVYYNERLSNLGNTDESEYDLKFIAKKAVLFSKKAYMNKEELSKMGVFIDEAIDNIENYTGRTLERLYGTGCKITYYLEPGINNHSGAGVYNHKPKILLGRNDVYVHEAGHIIAGEKSKWLSEGLNDYMQVKFGRLDCPPYSYYNNDVYECSKAYLNDKYKEMLDYIGIDNVFSVSSYSFNITLNSNQDMSTAFYALSCSFVKFLAESMGKDKFMKLYNLGCSSVIVKKETGKSMNEWKNAWLEELGAKGLQIHQKEPYTNWSNIVKMLIICIVVAMLIFSLLHRRRCRKKTFLW